MLLWFFGKQESKYEPLGERECRIPSPYGFKTNGSSITEYEIALPSRPVGFRDAARGWLG